MTIILPKKISVDHVLSEKHIFPDKEWASLEGSVSIPKWKSEFSLDLKKFMQQNGVNSIFDLRKANLNGIGNELYITSAIHKSFIEVNEEGTEAAAVTEMAAKPSAEPMETLKFVADRPFAYFIHTQEGLILFSGVVQNPANN